MPRKGPVPKREVLPDPLYNSRLVTKFVNRLMYDGKKGAAEKIFYSSLETLGEKTGEEPMRAFEKALDNVKPHLEVKARRVGGATYQVPMEVREERRATLMEIQAEISEQQLQEAVGQTMPVLVDAPHDEWPGLHVGRVWFQAPEVDGITYVSGLGVAPGALVQGDIVESSTYDLTALA